MTSALLYEDNDELRESIRTLLELSGEVSVVGDFKQATDVVSQVRQFAPSIVLMDIDMPGITGIEAVKQIRGFNRELPILMLTVFDDNANVFNALCAGASGYLLKKHVSSRLLSSINEVLDGGAPMSPAIARMVLSSMHTPATKTYDLTIREREILASLSKGNSYKLIAAGLEISIDTVRTHIKNIYAKLEVHSQTEAVSKAINEKLV
ncbi:MAG TPA: response regulator transcription factor [Ohtaekwangia sp.]|nr:response regulator transcription factor [Ohtaekwangia sp.]